MPRIRRILCLAGLVAALPAPALAQSLEPGTWTGSVTAPSGESLVVTYEVRVSGDTTMISIDAGSEGTFETHDVKVLEDRITFYFSPGPVVTCVLMKQEEDGSYKGDCTDPDGETGVLHMVPPAKE